MARHHRGERRGAGVRPLHLVPNVPPWHGATALAARRGGGISAPTFTMGALTKAAVLVRLVGAVTITSGNTNADWQVTGGYLSPTIGGDTRDMNSGPYTLGLSDGSTIVAVIEPNCYDVRTQADYNAVATPALITAASGGTFAFLAAGPYALNVNDGFGEIARNTTFLVPVIWKARDPALKAQMSTAFAVTSDNLQWYDLNWLASRFNFFVIQNASRSLTKLHWERCEFHGVLTPGATSEATWNNARHIATNGSNPIDLIDIIDCWFDVALEAVNLGALMRFQWVGNLVNDWWAVGVHCSVAPGASQADWTISDNVYVGPWAIANAAPDFDHPDIFLGTGNPGATVNSIVNAKRERFVQGGRRGSVGGFNWRDHTGAKKWTGNWGGYIVAGAQCNSPFAIEDTDTCNVSYVTAVQRGNPADSGAVFEVGGTSAVGVSTISNSIAELFAPSAGGTLTKTNNVLLGASAGPVTYLTAFVGPTLDLSAFTSTLNDLMADFAMTATGPANLNGGNPYGGIVPGVITWATTVPGHAGASGPF